jgi:hypothetical protein
MRNPYLATCILTMQGSENPTAVSSEDDHSKNPDVASEEDIAENPLAFDLETYLCQLKICVVGESGEITQFYEDKKATPIIRTYELQHGMAVLEISNVSEQPVNLQLQYFDVSEPLRPIEWNLSRKSPICTKVCKENCKHTYCTHACACNCSLRTHGSREHDIDQEDEGDDGWVIQDANGNKLLKIVFTTEHRQKRKPAGDLLVIDKRPKFDGRLTRSGLFETTTNSYTTNQYVVALSTKAFDLY